MFITSSVYHSVIFDPVQFLWAFMYFIFGPIIFVTSIILIILMIIRKEGSRFLFVIALLCLVLVPVWTFGFWDIGSICRPLMFSLVVKSNTELAEAALNKYPEGEEFTMRDFRYPLCKFPFYARRVYHKDGVLYILVPSGPGPKDTILYDPNNRLDHSRGCQHLRGNWWLMYYREG